MGNTPTSLRSNAQPTGGVTSTQGVQPTGALTPTQIESLIDQLTPAIQKFRASSSPLTASLEQRELKAGTTDTMRLATVGLGVRLRCLHTITLLLSNSASAAQTVDVSPFFPWNALSQTQIQLNGQTVVYNASGVAGLFSALRTRKGAFSLSDFGLSPALVSVTAGAGITLTTSTSPTFSGLTSLSVAATTNNATLTISFITFEKLARDRTSLLGALALQNNSVYATVSRTPVGSFVGSNAEAPLYVAGGPPSTLTANLSSWTVSTQYDFWSIPADPALYIDLIANSYQVQEQKGLKINGTGPSALIYDLPINQFLTALHILAYDGNGNPAALGWDTNLYVKYNAGGIVVYSSPNQLARGTAFADYGSDVLGFPGYALWDGNDTTSSQTESDSAGWLDTYYAANPQLILDIETTLAVPATVSITRESVVQNVQQVMS
jgi:hypothetical protein